MKRKRVNKILLISFICMILVGCQSNTKIITSSEVGGSYLIESNVNEIANKFMKECNFTKFTTTSVLSSSNWIYIIFGVKEDDVIMTLQYDLMHETIQQIDLKISESINSEKFEVYKNAFATLISDCSISEKFDESGYIILSYCIEK